MRDAWAGKTSKQDAVRAISGRAVDYIRKMSSPLPEPVHLRADEARLLDGTLHDPFTVLGPQRSGAKTRVTLLIPHAATPYLKLAPATKSVSVELTYRDGSVSEIKSFRR